MSAPVDWQLLQTFAEVARQESFTAAAGALGVHHSTVSRQMAALEGVLETRLFERQGRGVELTASAEVLRSHALAMEERAFAAVRAVAGRDIQLEGSVALTTTEELLQLVLPLLLEFRVRFPSVNLTIETGATFRDLGRREADVALRASVRPPEEAIAHRISTLPWAIFGRSADVLGWVDVRPVHSTVPAPPKGSPTVSVSSVRAAFLAIRAGLGRGALPCFLGRMSAELVELAAVPEAEVSNLWLLVHPDLRRVARVRALVDHLRTGLADAVPELGL